MKRTAKPKRELSQAQLDGLARSREKRSAALAAARAKQLEVRRGRDSAGAGAVLEPAAEPQPATDLVSQPAEPTAALGTQVEEGVSPMQAARPPDVPPPEIVARVEAARAALGSPPDAAPGAAPAPAAVQPTIVDPRLCVGLVELANDVTIRLMASSNGVPITPEVEKLTKLDPATKAHLEGLAPFAVPYLQELLNRGPMVGALIFGAVGIFAIAGNCGKLKKHKPARAPGKDKDAQPNGVAAPAAPETQAAPSTSAAIWGEQGWPPRNIRNR